MNQSIAHTQPSTLRSSYRTSNDLRKRCKKARATNNALNPSTGYQSENRSATARVDLRAKPASTFREFVSAKDSSDITSLLLNWNNGDQKALDTLVPLVERELRRLAHSYMRRENPDHLLQTTALVNEAYLRLTDQKRTRWQNRAHFFGIAAQVMRRILLNHARDAHRQKRGGNAQKVPLLEASTMSVTRSRELIVLDEALRLLARIDQRKSKVVELKFFGGLDVQEIAEVLGVSVITVIRDWKYARAWLTREIQNAA